MARMDRSRGGTEQLDGRPTARSAAVMREKLGTEFATRPTPAAAAISVDYPKSGESVISREYTFRISTNAPASVEVSIDDGAWLPCRQAAGYWWHDWSGYRSGQHSVVARIHLQQGRRILADRRDFAVELADLPV